MVIPHCLLLSIPSPNCGKGNKRDNITIIYTPWSNLKKDGSMATGQVSFTDQKMVKKIFIETRENAIINRLNKTKVEKQPDLQQERDDHVKELQDAKNRIRAKEVRLALLSIQYETYVIIDRSREATESRLSKAEICTSPCL